MTIKFTFVPTVIGIGEPKRIADRMHIAEHSQHTLELHATLAEFLINCYLTVDRANKFTKFHDTSRRLIFIYV